MGNNQAFTHMEASVIGAYNLGKLDRPLLDVLLDQYSGTDIDEGGREGLVAKDGKGLDQIVCEAFGLAELGVDEWPAKPGDDASDDERDAWDEQTYELFRKVTDHYGWC